MTYRSCDWKPQEDNRLLFYIGLEPPVSIARRLGRTERAVIDRYKAKHGGSFRKATARATGLSLADCAQLLGTNAERVRKWTKYKWLESQRRPVIGDRLITIKEEDLEAFIRERGGLLERLHPSDPYWVALFQEARAVLHERYVNTAELADVFAVSQGRFGKIAGFPVAAFSLQGRERWYERAAIRAWLATAPAHYRTARVLRAFGEDP